MDPPRPAGLGKAGEAVVAEHLAHTQGHPPHVVPARLGRGIEVDAQLIRMIELGRPDGPGVPVDNPKVDAPDEVGAVVGEELTRRTSAGERDGRGLEPFWRRVGDALLKERLLVCAVDEALEHGRAIAEVVDHGVGNRQVVVDEIELGDLWAGEEHLVRIRDPDLLPSRLDHRVLGHRGPSMTDTPAVPPLRGVPRTVLIAPDSFKGTLSATEVADALSRGLADGVRPVETCPLADGGEGTLEALLPALGGEIQEVVVADPLGDAVDRPLFAGR